MAPNEIASQIQAIVDELEKVQPGTTSYDEAQSLLTYANQKLTELRSASSQP
ncbi:MAG: hypothetical protein ACHWZW_09525 [Spirulina sp.]